MPYADFILPDEEVRFKSSKNLKYGRKTYQLIITDNRIVLYARRWLLHKKNDVVSFQLKELLTAKYKETGTLRKRGVIELYNRTLVPSMVTKRGVLEVYSRIAFQLKGPQEDTKAVYQQIMQFL